jgi:5-methylthioadenosine/S-adenosylhomocysteine deaminase
MRYRRFRGEADAPAPMTVDAILKAATVHCARAAGLEDRVGTLAVGKQADIIMVRTNSVAVFPVTHAIGTIVQAVGRSDVDTVMVAGQTRKRAGKLVDVDLVKLRTEVVAARDHLLEASGHRADLFATGASSRAG